MTNQSEEIAVVLQAFNKFQKSLNKQLAKSGRTIYIEHIEFNPYHACGGETEIKVKITQIE
jgi:hypothetical protein